MPNFDITLNRTDLTLNLAPTSTGGGSSGVSSVNGRQGVVTLTQADVNLSNVDNTSDASKPVSSATQTALNTKANTAHTHVKADVTDFAHNHDERYYTESEVDALLASAGGGGGSSSVVWEEVVATDAETWTKSGLSLEADGGVWQIDISFRFKNGLIADFGVNGASVTTRSMKASGGAPTGSAGNNLRVHSGDSIGYMSIRISKPVGFGYMGVYTICGAGSFIETGSFASANAYSGDENITSIRLHSPFGGIAVSEGTRIKISKVV